MSDKMRDGAYIGGLGAAGAIAGNMKKGLSSVVEW
jgi:hypothetical protein